MSVGLPVLASDRNYAHDICENCALFFNPLSVLDFTEKAVTLLKDQSLRAKMVKKANALIRKRNLSLPYKKMVDIAIKHSQSHF
jgi:glycosyltransferase involved in cell wall biosynthesis